MFLALGLSALIAFEMLLISGGVLGAIPLSGVVSPFLSFGNTAMLANFLIFGILVAISNQGTAKRASLTNRSASQWFGWSGCWERPRRRCSDLRRTIKWRTIRIFWRARRRSLKTTASSGRSAIRG